MLTESQPDFQTLFQAFRLRQSIRANNTEADAYWLIWTIRNRKMIVLAPGRIRLKCYAEPMERQAFTYILTCADGSLYTGWTLNLEQRLKTHNEGRGARYTRTRLPVQLVASWAFESKQDAMRFEYQIKQLSRTQKLSLIGKPGWNTAGSS